MFNKENRFMQSYIRKTGYETSVTSYSKDGSFSGKPHYSEYILKIPLSYVTSFYCSYAERVVYAGTGDTDYTNYYEYCFVQFYKNNTFMKEIEVKSRRTYSVDVEADTLIFPKYKLASYETSEYQSATFTVYYDVTDTKEYTYIAKY